MGDQIQNFIKEPVSGVHIAGVTTINVANATNFPDPTSGNYNLTWWNATTYPDPSDDPLVEIVRVTARNVGGNTLTVTRAQEGTSDSNKNIAGVTYILALCPTKKVMDEKINTDAIDTTVTLGNSDTKIPSQKAVKTYADNDWRISESATYSSPGILNIGSDVTGKYSIGMKYKYQQDQALSHYWTFGSSSSPDVGIATMGNIGTPTYTAGKFGNALTLNGTTQGLSITDAAGFKPTGDYTIGCWFKTSAATGTKELFQSYSANTSIAGIRLEVNLTEVRFYVGKNTGIVNGSDYIVLYSNATVTDGNWHYVVVSVRNNFAQMYIDGVLGTSRDVYTPGYAATNYVRIGCGNDSGTNIRFMNGQIDDLFIINGYALDEKTIKEKYDTVTAQGTGNITIQKYAKITNVGASTGSITPITIDGGVDYTLSNTTISNPYFSTAFEPFGFDTRQSKWIAGDTDGEWKDWKTVFNNLTIGDATVVARYNQTGKTVNFSLNVILGATSSVASSPSFILPRINSNNFMQCLAYLHGFLGVSQPSANSAACTIFAFSSDGTYPARISVTATVPVTWANLNAIRVNGTYETI